MNYYINPATYADLLATCRALEQYEPTPPALAFCRGFVEDAVVLQPDADGWYTFPAEEGEVPDFRFYLPRGVALPGYLLQNAFAYAEMRPELAGFALLDGPANFCLLTPDQMGEGILTMIDSVEQLMKPSQVKGSKPTVFDVGDCCEVVWGAQHALMEQRPGLMEETVEQMKANFAQPCVPLLAVSRWYLDKLGKKADRYAVPSPYAKRSPLFDSREVGFVRGTQIEVEAITADGVETIATLLTNRTVCHVFAPVHELADPEYGRLYPVENMEV